VLVVLVLVVIQQKPLQEQIQFFQALLQQVAVAVVHALMALEQTVVLVVVVHT
jgi:uncharacterized membrane protein